MNWLEGSVKMIILWQRRCSEWMEEAMVGVRRYSVLPTRREESLRIHVVLEYLCCHNII